MASTLISNGRVYNTQAHRFDAANILIVDDKIEAILLKSDLSGTDASRIAMEKSAQAADVILDATDLYITPGFIDLHCHIFKHSLYHSGRLDADRIGVRQGVSCLIDTGSAGPTMIDAFKEFVIDTQQTACFALCNVGSPGQPGIEGGHSAKPELISLSGTVKAIERNPDWILGVKVLASSTHTGLMGLEAVKIGRKAAEISGTPLMVHIGNAPPVVDDVLDLLRPGDIVTHAYHGKVGGVLGYKDKVIPQFKAAVERGVIIDIAHGRSSFSYRTCEAALQQGMPVHTISSDLHKGNVDRYVVSLARTMSKFLTLGLSIEDIVKSVTLAPANALGLDRFGFGELKVGAAANISAFKLIDKSVEMEDAEGEVRTSKQWIEPQFTFVSGQHCAVSEIL